jgi:hypothetical protein
MTGQIPLLSSPCNPHDDGAGVIIGLLSMRPGQSQEVIRVALLTRGVLPPPSRRKAGIHGAMGTGIRRCGKALGVIRSELLH